MTRRIEPITAALPVHEARISAGIYTDADAAYLTEVARLCAAYAFRLDVATTDRERAKLVAGHTRAHHAEPDPDETPDVPRMRTDPAYLSTCLEAASSEQRIRRTTRPRTLALTEVFADQPGDALRLLTPAMVTEITGRLATFRDPVPELVRQAVSDVYRVFTDGRTDLGEQVAAHRFLTRATTLFAAAGASVAEVKIGPTYRTSSLVLRTRHGREVRIQAMGAYCQTVPVLGADRLLHDLALGRAVEVEQARLLLAAAVAGAIVEEVLSAGRGPHPLSRSSAQVGADGTVGFHVMAGQFGRTLKVAGRGAVYDSTYDAHPAIGVGFLTAAAEQAGADPGEALGLLITLAGMIRTDHDVAALVPAAATGAVPS